MLLHSYQILKEKNSYKQFSGTHLKTSDLDIFKSLSFETEVTAAIPKSFNNSVSLLLILLYYFEYFQHII